MKKIFLGILLGLFCMTSYHVIWAVIYFHNLSIVREQARQKIIFYQRGNKYIATIMIEKDDWLYYLNWFPEIYLSKNSAEFLGSRSSHILKTMIKGGIIISAWTFLSAKVI